MNPASDYTPTKKHGPVLMVIFIVMMLGGVVFWQYLVKQKLDAAKMAGRPSYQFQLKENLSATEMQGQEVNLAQLDGKVWVGGFLYTLCPRGCAGLAEEMHQLQTEFGSDPLFQLVSISLNAEWDTPERLKVWTEKQGFHGANWWFLTGDGVKLRGYVKDQLKLPVSEVAEKDRKNEFDKYDHKLALVLVDHKHRVRGTYDFSQPEMNDVYREKLRTDLQAVLKEARAPATPGD